jgi:methanogenic corrinoid protein MtbC1
MNSADNNMADLQKLYDAILGGDQKTAVAVTMEALAESAKPVHLVTNFMVPAMDEMRTTINALKQAGVRQRVKVMVGGAPVTQQFADEIGADGYSDNASAAVTLARTLVGLGRS